MRTIKKKKERKKARTDAGKSFGKCEGGSKNRVPLRRN